MPGLAELYAPGGGLAALLAASQRARQPESAPGQWAMPTQGMDLRMPAPVLTNDAALQLLLRLMTSR